MATIEIKLRGADPNVEEKRLEDLCDSEEYRRIVKETDEKIKEAQIRQVQAYIRAKDFVAL